MKTQTIKNAIKKLFLLATIVFSTINSVQSQNKEDAIIGTWEMNDGSAKMKVFKAGNEYQAQLLWGKDIVNPDGSSKKDLNNPDKKLQSRNLLGIIYLTGLIYHDGQYEKGRIYNNANGKTYKCYVWIKKGKLHLRGYLGMKMLGQTTQWKRIEKH